MKSFLRIAVLMVLLVFSSPLGRAQDLAAVRWRSFHYEIVFENSSSQVMRDVALRVFVPCTGTAGQGALRLRSQPAGKVTSDAWGNQVLALTLKRVAPFGRKRLVVQGRFEVDEGNRSVEEEGVKAYLAASPKVESDAAEIRGLAGRFRQKDRSSRARAILHFVHGKLKSSPYTRRTRGALWALRNGRGDCTEAACLFAALCRAAGLPCRVVSGWIDPKGGQLLARAYHEWAEFWDGRRWSAVDPKAGQFDLSKRVLVTSHVETPGEDLGRRMHRFELESKGAVW